ncbi:MAG TPA: hypothetical protein VLV76_07940 [Candidatus Acidoferrum sp.]|nr:hypothetical protein [Candidatus Acidoferrum sp.]
MFLEFVCGARMTRRALSASGRGAPQTPKRLFVLGQSLAAALTGLLSRLHDFAVAIRILADLAIIAAMALLAAHVVIALTLAGVLRLLPGHGTIVAGAMRRLRIALLPLLRIVVFVRHLLVSLFKKMGPVPAGRRGGSRSTGRCRAGNDRGLRRRI